MNKSNLLFLFDYTQWANHRLLDTAARLPTEKFADPHRTTYGSLRGILVHILVSYQVWLGRCRDGRMPPVFPIDEEFPDVAAFNRRFSALEAELRAYLESLSEDDMQRLVTHTTSRGEVFTNRLWQIFTHLFNHATQHRSEAAEVMTEYGESPGNLDLIWYLREIEG
ncbi:MAG: DinB family protein [Chloroflexota bacterium]